MKRLTIVPLLFSFCAVIAQRHIAYEIRGTIKHFKPGEKIYFMRVKTGHALDSVSLTDSVFVFKDETDISDEPELNQIETDGHIFIDHSGKGIDFDKTSLYFSRDMIQVYLEPGVTRLKIADSAHNAIVIPPRQNAGHYTLDSIYTARYKKLSAALHEIKTMGLQKKEASDFLQKSIGNLDAEQESDLWHFVRTHPNSPVSIYILQHDRENYPDYDKLAPYFDALSPELKNTTFGKQYAAMLASLQRTRLGIQAPDFTLEDPNGKKVSMSSFRGKYLLVDFWASWCEPCREENPSVVSAYNQFNGKNFTVLGVSLDKTKDAWLKAIMDDNLAWTQVSDLKFWDNAAAQLYAVKAIPQNFLLDPQGHIIAKNLFGKQLTEKLKKLFNNDTSEDR